MTSALNDQSLDQIFRSARTFNSWADRPVGDDTVREIYDLMKWGPTSANSCPARFVWVRSADGKATLAGLAAEPNKPFKDNWVFDITVRDGKVTNIREYIDTQALARASRMDSSGLA